jgi:hypothetical protein
VRRSSATVRGRRCARGKGLEPTTRMRVTTDLHCLSPAAKGSPTTVPGRTNERLPHTALMSRHRWASSTWVRDGRLLSKGGASNAQQEWAGSGLRPSAGRRDMFEYPRHGAWPSTIRCVRSIDERPARAAADSSRVRAVLASSLFRSNSTSTAWEIVARSSGRLAGSPQESAWRAELDRIRGHDWGA